MNINKLSVAAMLVATAGTAVAATQVAQVQPTPPAQPRVEVQATAVPVTQAPKTREQVREELARAKASGEYDRMVMWYVDPFPVDPRMVYRPGQ